MSDIETITSFATVAPLPSLWGGEEEQKINILNWKPFIQLDKELEKYKETEAIGYGVERCLYELNPELVCLSPYLIHAAVLTPTEALIALEAVAGQPDRPQSPIDRHLAAFLMSRWKGLSHADLRNLGKPQRELKNLATLRILAGIQVYFKVQELPNICQWMAELCAPITMPYRNLKLRARVQRDIEQAVSTGQLIKLIDIFTNRQELLKDDEDFKLARTEVWLIESEIKEIEAKIRNRNQSALNSQPSLWEKMPLFLHQITQARALKQGQARIARLYQRWVVLRETWGDVLLFQSENSSRSFWKTVRTKMQELGSSEAASKKAVDAPVKYD